MEILIIWQRNQLQGWMSLITKQFTLNLTSKEEAFERENIKLADRANDIMEHI